MQVLTWLAQYGIGRRAQKALATLALLLSTGSLGAGPLGGGDGTRRPIDTVDDIRERLLQSDGVSASADAGGSQFAQWPNWRNYWPNWSDWNNWRNWGNWPNWRNW